MCKSSENTINCEWGKATSPVLKMPVWDNGHIYREHDFPGSFYSQEQFPPSGWARGLCSCSCLAQGTPQDLFSCFISLPCPHRQKCGYQEVAKAASAEPGPEFVSPLLHPVPGWLLAKGKLCCGHQPSSLGAPRS